MNIALKTYLIEKAGLTEDEFKKLEVGIKYKSISKGNFLLREGEVCEATFFVETGVLRSFSIDESGKEHIIQFAPENWFISDRGSVYFNEVSEIFIDAVEDTKVAIIDSEFLTKASKISSAFRAYNDKLLHNHIRHLQKRLNLLLSATSEKRYLNFINLYPDLTLRVPQWMIASYLGITPESLSRVRKELATKNFKKE
ncbi:MAG: Crp/Fnr family transcriptional regulator [Ferruginibacter sp.]